MKIDSKFNKGVFGTARKLYTPFFFIIVGVVFCALTAFLIYSTKDTLSYEKVDAVIVDIIENENTVVEYTYNGQTYTAKTNSYSSSDYVGDTITVLINPESPDQPTSSPMTFYIVFGVIGVGGLAIGIYQLISRTKQSREDDEMAARATATNTVVNMDQEFRVSLTTSDFQDYYFRFCGKANQSHLLETTDRVPKYEAKLTHFSLFGDCDYDFIDHRYNRTTHHLVGKTVTENEGSMSEQSGFPLDGKDVWRMLHSNGISLDMDVSLNISLPTFIVKYKDQVIGELKQAGANILPGKADNVISQNLGTPGLYRVKTSEENIPIIFLVGMALSRSNQTVSY